MSDIDQMVKMANQIAQNFSFHDDQVERTADHLRRFWAPQMRRKLAHHVSSGGQGLSEPALQALKQVSAQAGG
ncbi:MAG: formate dehydrogenase subunit delta [Xanthomonadales bacterium]|nr:formate dehydrogenase subunit delta [Xanthomonadales bacterium]